MHDGNKIYGIDDIVIYCNNEKKQCTESFKSFAQSFSKSCEYFLFVINHVHNIENLVRTSSSLVGWIIDKNPDYADRETLIWFMNNREYFSRFKDGRMVAKFRDAYSDHIMATLVNEAANTFVWYLSAIVKEILVSSKNTIKSSDMIKVENIVRHETMDSLLEFIIEKKINELSYGGLSEMEGYLQKRTNIDVFESDTQRQYISFLIELRNIQTHNLGIVNEVFLHRAPKIEGIVITAGARVEITLELFERLASYCLSAAINIDLKARSKYPLKLQA